jgi:hypothetical protein
MRRVAWDMQQLDALGKTNRGEAPTPAKSLEHATKYEPDRRPSVYNGSLVVIVRRLSVN